MDRRDKNGHFHRDYKEPKKKKKKASDSGLEKSHIEITSEELKMVSCVHSKMSHSKPFYPNNSMSLVCLDAGLELPIHRVQESVFQVQGLSSEP